MKLTKKNTIIKLATSVTVSSALLGVASVTNDAHPKQTVQAATRSRIQLTHNAYVYNRYGHRKGRTTLRKYRKLYSYGTKTIKHKKYYYLGNGNYIKAANAKKATTKRKVVRNKEKALFTVNAKPTASLYKNVDGAETGTGIEGKIPVYQKVTDRQGRVWYRTDPQYGCAWLLSADTSKPQGNIASPRTNSDDSINSENHNSFNSTVSKPQKSVKHTGKSNASSIWGKFQTTQFKQEVAQSFIDQLNNLRASKGLKTLSVDSILMAFANTRSQELLVKFSHTRPNGEQMNNEDIAENFVQEDSTASSVAKAFLNEFIYNDADWNWAHRNSLLNPDHSKIGVGVSVDKKPGVSWANYDYPNCLGLSLDVQLDY